MKAQQLNIDVTSHNLANVNTAGFKKGRAEFQDLMYRTARAAGAPVNTGSTTPVGMQVGNGVRSVAISRIFSQGDFQQTENPYDLTVEGEGFFQVQLPDGTTAYTRDGTFKIDAQGQLVTSEGYLLQPNVTIPQNAKDLTISGEGVVTATIDNNAVQLGELQIARFVNPSGLTALGQNLFRPTAASGDPMASAPGVEGMGRILQGYVESSNVRVIEEMVNLIVAQRAYEANSKSIQTADDMLQGANSLKR
jgi:flagellar basal-body rod protein FlgG